MKTILHFFNYDLTIRVQDFKIAPAGLYKQAITNDVLDLYYCGPPDNERVVLKNIIYKDSWQLTDEEVFRW